MQVGNNPDRRRMKSAFSDFNKEFFSLENLTVKSLFLDETSQLITIRGLENSNKALQYFNAIKGYKWITFQCQLTDKLKEFICFFETTKLS